MIESLRGLFLNLNTCSTGERVPDIERYITGVHNIQTIKDLCFYQLLSFYCMPHSFLFNKNAVILTELAKI